MPNDKEWKHIIELDAQLQFQEVVNSPWFNWGCCFVDFGLQALGLLLPVWHQSSSSECVEDGVMFTFGPPVLVGMGQEAHYFTPPPRHCTKVCPMVDRHWDPSIASCVQLIGGSSKCANNFTFRSVAAHLEMTVKEC